jgi:hypothetical protein
LGPTAPEPLPVVRSTPELIGKFVPLASKKLTFCWEELELIKFELYFTFEIVIFCPLKIF